LVHWKKQYAVKASHRLSLDINSQPIYFIVLSCEMGTSSALIGLQFIQLKAKRLGEGGTQTFDEYHYIT